MAIGPINAWLKYDSPGRRCNALRGGIAALMIPTGNWWGNARSETLFASLKLGRLHGQRFGTIGQAKYETLA